MSSGLTRLDPIESTQGEADRAPTASTATAVRNMVITTTQGDVQENFGEEMRATTEACVDLVTLLLSCRHLKTFRYLGRRISSDGDSYLPYENYTKFQMIFALIWSRMIANSCGSKQQPPSTEQEECRPFACLKQVYITELGPWSWSQFLRDLLSLPELDTLSYIFPIDAWAFSLDPSPTRSATLQDLHLSTTAVDQRNFRALFGAVQNLTSLHLDISGISFKERNFDTYINILREHGSLLAKLCITARSGALKKLPPVSFSLFTRVKILSVPDSLLYDSETTIDGFISRLPRKVEELTVTVQASRERTSALLVDPALNKDQLPALKKVTVLVPDHENGSANHELGVWLRPISRIFTSRSLGFHYGKVSTTQPLHSG
ncbi:uncharacterized protein APUU_31391S [Aspergillus puulaauensis]|uniref:F-box domain protein n=1 Tax=Aspergillus puulaauensis TaxID=1220207 RepID=A0A7R7XKJ6_9EURO|nr:uncharacterized protein APUU_31391S [Aspergillus puulaauensis]BCS23166.1 hypothetical protein APUU_31391S [Aspergillus puulaauensis]